MVRVNNLVLFVPRHFSVRLACSLLTIIATSGCIMSNGPVHQAADSSANQMVVIGIPVLLGGFGSAVPINEEYMITAKHVAKMSWDFNIIHHPYCDLSLIRRSSDHIPTWGLIYPNQPVSHHGHSLLGSSIRGDGKYLQDVIDTNTDCLYSLSDAPVMSGMSGGPVFNKEGEVVGITVAIVDNPEDLRNLRPAIRYSQFVPATLIFDWLDALGITTSSASPALASIQVSPYVTDLNRPGSQPTSSPRHNDKHRQASGVLATSDELPPDNSAEALSGLRKDPESEPQLTSKQQTKPPVSEPNLPNTPGYNSSY